MMVSGFLPSIRASAPSLTRLSASCHWRAQCRLEQAGHVLAAQDGIFTRSLTRRRQRPTSQWHLDEMAVIIAGRQFWLWRAVDDEGEFLDLLVQRRRDKAAARQSPK
jgi:hypothetical protein